MPLIALPSAFLPSAGRVPATPFEAHRTSQRAEMDHWEGGIQVMQNNVLLQLQSNLSTQGRVWSIWSSCDATVGTTESSGVA